MSYLYLVVAIWLAFCAVHSGSNAKSKLFLQFPAIVFSITFGILAANSFGLI